MRINCIGASSCKKITSVTLWRSLIWRSLAQSTGKGLHCPVMMQEVLNIVNPQDDQVIVDMTFGAGGHTKALLQRAPNAKIFALDRDPVAHSLALNFAKEYPQVTPLLGRFSEVHKLLAPHGIGAGDVDAIIMDLGASSMQFDNSDRGFALSKDGPLDMRMDKDRFPDQPTAADVVNFIDEKSLIKVLKKYGEERQAQLVAHAIIDSRYAFGKISTTKQLADIVATAFSSPYYVDKLNRKAHVATRTFQALRIFVNDELNEIHNGLEIAHALLCIGGVCSVLSFHSLEDRIVKRHFHGINMDETINMSINAKLRSSSVVYSKEYLEAAMERRWEPHSRKLTEPSEAEVEANPRSRSAKMRSATKIH